MKELFSQLRYLLNKFSAGELKEIINDLFADISWGAISASLRKNRLSFQSKFIAMTISNLYENSDPSKDSLQFIVWALEFYDKTAHSSSNWHGIHLTNQVEEVSNTQTIERNIVRSYRTDARDAEVMIKVDDLIYIMTIEKKTTPKGIKYKKPFFFFYNSNIGEPYAFYSPKFCGCEDLVTYCCKGVGFDCYEEISLNGKDFISMFGMIERELNYSTQALVPINYQPATVVEEDGVVDFRLAREREKYAEEVLPGLTNLQTFSVEAHNEWRGSPFLPELEGVKIQSSITITSSAPNLSVERVMKEMIRRGMVQLPVPSYIANISNISKNVVQLDADEPQEATDSESGSDW